MGNVVGRIHEVRIGCSAKGRRKGVTKMCHQGLDCRGGEAERGLGRSARASGPGAGDERLMGRPPLRTTLRQCTHPFG